MDQKHLSYPVAFSNQLPHAYSQWPSSRPLPPMSNYNHQQFLQSHQASIPYPSSQSQLHTPIHQPCFYNNQWRPGTMAVTGCVPFARAIGNGNNVKNHVSVSLQPGEDLMSFDDEPTVNQYDQASLQNIQPLPQLLSTAKEAVATVGQSSSNYSAGIQNRGVLQNCMDNKIHHPYQSQASPYRPLSAAFGNQNNSIQQSSACLAYTRFQHPTNARYFNAQPKPFQCPPRQVPRSRGLFSYPGPVDNAYKPTQHLRSCQHGAITTLPAPSRNTSNIRSDTSAPNVHPRTNVPRKTITPIIFQKCLHTASTRNSSTTLAGVPKAQPSADANQNKHASLPVLPPQSVETNIQHSAHKAVAEPSATKSASLLSFSEFQSQHMQTESGCDNASGNLSVRQPSSNTQNRYTPPTHVKYSKDSSKPPESSPPQRVIQPGQTARRTVRTALFNSRSGEVTQAAGGEVTQDKTIEVAEGGACNKQESQSSKDETTSNSSHSTQTSPSSMKMPATSRIAPNSGERLLSFEELFGSSNNTPEPEQRPTVTIVPESDIDRPLTLNELKQLRDAAASEQSTSTSSGSPLLNVQSDHSSESPPTDFGQLCPLVIRSIPNTSEQPLVVDQDLFEESPGKPAKVVLPSPTQSFRNEETSAISAHSTLQVVESISSLSISESIVSSKESSTELTTQEPNSKPIVSLAPVSEYKNMSTESFPCRYCPDEYTTGPSRDLHATNCRRKSGWPKNCCFCGAGLADREVLSKHARTCAKSRPESLHNTTLSRFVMSHSTNQGNKQTPPAGPSGKAENIRPPRGPRNGTPWRGGRGARGSGRSNTSSQRNGITKKSSTTTVPFSASTNQKSSASASVICSSSITKESPAVDNLKSGQYPRRRRRGPRKS